MTTMNSDEREQRLKQIRERWMIRVSNTKSWGEWPTLQSVGGIKGAMADIDFLLSLLDSQVTGAGHEAEAYIAMEIALDYFNLPFDGDPRTLAHVIETRLREKPWN